MTAFVLLVVVDLGYLGLDIGHNLLFGPARASFEVHRDHSLPEFYQYMKLGWSLLLVMVLAFATRSGRVLLWAPVLALLLATDSLTLHEEWGGVLAHALNLPVVAGLRPRDLGELMVGGTVAGLTALCLLAVWRTSPRWHKSFHRRMLLLLLALGLFGQCIDMVTSMASGSTWQSWLSRIEDGGEMVVVSALCALLVATVIEQARRPITSPSHR